MRVCLIALLVFTGCATTTPCPPPAAPIEVELPIYRCPPPVELLPVELPPWPVLAADPTPEQIKIWYADMVAMIKARETLLLEDSAACRGILEAYRTPPG